MNKRVLYIVPTPIGNLKDITYRSIDVLNNSELIIAERISHSFKLLNYYKIKKKVIKYNKICESKNIENIIKFINKNNISKISIISDAGYPSISDPGYLLIKKFIKLKIKIICLPGSNSILPSLIVSGFPIDEFTYLGFLTKKNIKKKIKKIKKENRTTVFFDSPYRFINTLKVLLEILGPNRKIIIYKEISKIHESIIRGTIKKIYNKYQYTKIRGEITFVIKKN